VIGQVSEIASPPQLREGVSLRDVAGRAELERIAALEQAVWGDDHDWLPEMLDAEQVADPDGLAVVVAEAGGTIVCAAWARFASGTDFVTLWGGATLPEWRGQGIYRATVAHRANLAAARGFRLLEVDASSDSRPILERLGFAPVTTTTPYVWSPRA
jgi:GNAT superfamily N-acetyltransferase